MLQLKKKSYCTGFYKHKSNKISPGGECRTCGRAKPESSKRHTHCDGVWGYKLNSLSQLGLLPMVFG